MQLATAGANLALGQVVSRAAIARVLADTIRWGSYLWDRSNWLIPLPPPFSQPEMITIMLGARAHRTLTCIKTLSRSHVDDQIAVLARSLAEMALDAEYLHFDTVRDGKVLTTKDKARLFLDYKVIAQKRMVEAFPADREAWLHAARTFRRPLIGKQETYWHGAARKQVLGELKGAITGGFDTDRLEEINRLFRDLSFFVHTNPNDGAYFEIDPVRRKLQLKKKVRIDEVLAMATLGGIDVFVRWALDIEPRTKSDEQYEKAINLIRRLPERRPPTLP